MLKGLLGGMASAGRGLTGIGGESGRKGSGELKRTGVAGIFGKKKNDEEIHRNSSGDKELPLSGSPNPEHRAIARRRIGGMRPSTPPANMDKGKKKGIFQRLMEMKQKYNPLDRATAPLDKGQKQSGMRPKTNRYNA